MTLGAVKKLRGVLDLVRGAQKRWVYSAFTIDYIQPQCFSCLLCSNNYKWFCWIPTHDSCRYPWCYGTGHAGNWTPGVSVRQSNARYGGAYWYDWINEFEYSNFQCFIFVSLWKSTLTKSFKPRQQYWAILGDKTAGMPPRDSIIVCAPIPIQRVNFC